MEFDIRTVLLLLFLVSGLLALMLVIYWKTQRTYEGFDFWTLAAVLTSLGYLLITLRGSIPVFFSVVLANIFLIYSVLLRVDGIRRFFRSGSVPVIAYAILLPAFLLFFWYTYVNDAIAIRGILSAALIVPGLLLVGGTALAAAGQENRYIRYSFVTALVIYAFVYCLRTLYWLVIAEPATVFSTDEFNSIFFIVTLLMDILAAGFFLMLNMVRAQTDLAGSEERYRTLSDSLPDYVVVHDGKTILYANPATGVFTSISADRLTGLPIEDFIAPESRAESTGVIRKIQGDPGSGQPREIIILPPGGNRHTCIIRSVPVRYEGREAILSVLTDITGRKQIEDSLRMANRKLNLLSGITRHDIRNQLTALSAYIHLAGEAAATKTDLQEFFIKEQQIADTIARQINFTGDYEELGVKSPAWQDAGAVIRSAATALPLHGTTLDIRCDKIGIFADPLLEKVFYNLIDNSLRYGGDRMTTIRISTEDADGELRLIYDDNGAGISAEDRGRLFTRGFGKNTGLGLFLSREILGITGITITENGGLGTGARFVITVPDGSWRRAPEQ